MRKKPEISEDDKALLQKAMRGVKPLDNTKILGPRFQVAHRVKKTVEDEEPEGFPFSDYEKLDPVTGDTQLFYHKPGIQHKILRKLRQGKYNVEAVLDLHGMNGVEARDALSYFLQKCQRHGIRHILIIHGKGRDNNKPVLKNKLNHWLRQTDQVIAFCSATAKDGRSGAMYVLLKSGETNAK